MNLEYSEISGVSYYPKVFTKVSERNSFPHGVTVTSKTVLRLESDGIWREQLFVCERVVTPEAIASQDFEGIPGGAVAMMTLKVEKRLNDDVYRCIILGKIDIKKNDVSPVALMIPVSPIQISEKERLQLLTYPHETSKSTDK